MRERERQRERRGGWGIEYIFCLSKEEEEEGEEEEDGRVLLYLSIYRSSVVAVDPLVENAILVTECGPR